MDKNKFLPDQWPNKLFGMYGYSRDLIKRNLAVIVVLTVLETIANGVLNRPPTIDNNLSFIFGLNIISMVIGSLLSAAVTVAFIISLKDKDADLQDTLKQALPKTLNVLLYSIISFFIIIVSLVALIIPFFIVAPRLIFGQYMIVDKDLDAMSALRASWDLSKGNYGKIYKIFFAGFLMALLILTIIGIPFAIYFLFMYQAAFFILYRWLDKNPDKNSGLVPKTPLPPKPSTPKPIVG